jgi:transposase
MEVIVERVAALDVHKEQVTAFVRVPAAGREAHLAQFATTVRGLLALGDWLAAHQVSQVVMEATGVYWKPVWHILEDDFELMLVNARHVKQVPDARPTSRTRRGCASWPRRGYCGRTLCLPSRSATCGS